MNKTIDRLEQALAEKFCLQGSPVMGLTCLESRQAWCRGNHPDNCQYAVYADPHSVQRPLIHATTMKLCGEHKSSHEYDGDGVGLLTVTGTNVTLGIGSIYVLRRDTFQSRGHEFLSYAPVPVVKEIIVSPRTLYAIRHDYDLRIPVPPLW